MTAPNADAIEETIIAALDRIEQPGCPPKLAAAMRDAMLPGGARVRPRLMMAVAAACELKHVDLALSAAASLEMLHCASLVHDDLPAFDDAAIRRGKPSVHKRFGEPIGILTGDALILLAFEELARGAAAHPKLLPLLTQTLARSVGMPAGLCAGQAWEEEAYPDLQAYHAAKTGALFSGVTVMGATVANHPTPDAWARFGMELGTAYQMADDICDVTADEKERGKPTGQDKRLNRPNIAHRMGVSKAVDALMNQIQLAVNCIPDCRGRDTLDALVRITTRNFLPDDVWALAA